MCISIDWSFISASPAVDQLKVLSSLIPEPGCNPLFTPGQYFVHDSQNQALVMHTDKAQCCLNLDLRDKTKAALTVGEAYVKFS